MDTHDGGKPERHDVMGYKAPVGPRGLGDPWEPGIHGHNYGNDQMARPSGCSKPEQGITNHGNAGSQGRH